MVKWALIATFALILPMQFGGCASSGKTWAPPGQVKKKTGYNPASGKVHPVKGKAKGK